MTNKEIKDLTPEERAAILQQARERQQRELEDRIIARELARREQETQEASDRS